jgi:hypothetical protein
VLGEFGLDQLFAMGLQRSESACLLHAYDTRVITTSAASTAARRRSMRILQGPGYYRSSISESILAKYAAKTDVVKRCRTPAAARWPRRFAWIGRCRTRLKGGNPGPGGAMLGPWVSHRRLKVPLSPLHDS